MPATQPAQELGRGNGIGRTEWPDTPCRWRPASWWRRWGLNGFQWYRGGERLSSATDRVGQLRQEISRLNRQISDQSLAGLSPAPVTVAVPDQSGAEMDRLVEELSQAQSQRRSALAKLRSRSRKLVETQEDADALNRALEQARNSETQLSEKLARVERALQTRTSELEALRKQGATREVALALQEKQIGELARTVNEQAETIRRDQELLAADRDIRDLMTDRNLRVQYVQDNDPDGEQIVDARVFYAEGQAPDRLCLRDAQGGGISGQLLSASLGGAEFLADGFTREPGYLLCRRQER